MVHQRFVTKKTMVPVYCQFLPACKIIRCTKENKMVKIKALNCMILTDAFDKAYDFPVVEYVNIANNASNY